MGLTLCQKVKGCCHPPNHLGVCEVNARPSKPAIAEAVSFLDQQERTAQLVARVAEDLLIVVGANTVMFDGGLTREALDVLVQAKCELSANRNPIPLSTVTKVLDALERVREYLKTPAAPAPQEEEPRRSRRR